MRNVAICLFLCLILAALGCSQMADVKTDFDDQADFDAFKTFAWVHSDTESMNLTDKWKLVDEYIKDAIIKEMGAKGVTLSPGSPDLLVVYTVGMRDKLGQVDFNADYSVDRSNAEIYSEGGGLVVMDLFDAKTDHLVWRGEALIALNVDPSPDIMRKNVNNVIKKLLKNYPPNAKPLR
jgi:hypothetical protein